ncbi:MAG: hypothetical protein DSZ11_06160 [Sulfurovum sp.]|nr:MAG: hypothetical protein DSZ11_06160 [Sulfurovum sp.]
MIKTAKTVLLTLLLTILLSPLSHAEWSDSLSHAYETSKEKSQELYHSAKQKLKPKQLTPQELKEQHFSALWEEVFEEYQEGASLLEASQNAPNSAWFTKDKLDYKGDLDHVLNNIIGILTEDNLLFYKDEIGDKKDNIYALKLDIIHYREKMVGAPKESMIHTTKSQYQDKIKNAKDEINIFKNDIETIKRRLTQRFQENGIHLSTAQIEVLLTRVDGDDIIQMTVIMDILNKITQQILNLMQESNEELSQAKKYYGMHLISWQLVIYIQQKYIDKVNNNFVPQIEHIINQTNKMMGKTSRLYEMEPDSQKKRIYQKNLNIQAETKKVAERYKEQLLLANSEMKKAQQLSLSNLKLAQNTYYTVSLSSELYSVISESQTLFNKIAKIQMPNIVPFENKKIKKKYQEITGKLLNNLKNQ